MFILLASLDNVAIGLVPPLFSPISQSLGVTEGAISLAVGATYIVSAVAAVCWAYFGDRTNRKPLLMLGTLIWAAGTVGTPFAANYGLFLAAQLVAAIGLGAVASVGFSVVSDLIAPRRRGLVMSLWGVSQGVGTLAGTLLGGLLGSSQWHRPFYVLAGVGVMATVLYLFTANIRRGESEPELAAVFRSCSARWCSCPASSRPRPNRSAIRRPPPSISAACTRHCSSWARSSPLWAAWWVTGCSGARHGDARWWRRSASSRPSRST